MFSIIRLVVASNANASSTALVVSNTLSALDTARVAKCVVDYPW